MTYLSNCIEYITLNQGKFVELYNEIISIEYKS